jgi:hypothetical protein
VRARKTTTERMAPTCLAQLVAARKVSAFVLWSANARANTCAASIELGSSSGDKDAEADDNTKIKDEDSDTHMSGSDRRSFHAPITEDTC